MEIWVRPDMMPGMRKWVVIGAISIVVVAGFVISQLAGLSKPRKGTVTYHKVEFLKARTLGPVAGYLDEMGAINDPKRNRREFHRRALLDAGYLTTSTFIISNRPVTNVWLQVWTGLAAAVPAEASSFVDAECAGSNSITVVAPSTAMDKVGEFIRKLDVPETGQ